MTSAFQTNHHPDTELSLVIPCYNEQDLIADQLSILARQVDSRQQLLSPQLYEIIIVDNGSSDSTVQIVRDFQAKHPHIQLYITHEPNKGVSPARRKGFAEALTRHTERCKQHGLKKDILLLSADADCEVAADWLFQLHDAMKKTNAAMGISHYFFDPDCLAGRPRLEKIVSAIMQAREFLNGLFGGFPDGKGFAIWGSAYEKVGGIELFYHLEDGQFKAHPSDDWDFGVKTRAAGEEIIYAGKARVKVHPRRLDGALDDMVNGFTYGKNGVLVMRDVREHSARNADLSPEQAELLWNFSIKDLAHKYIILPLMLTHSLFEQAAVRDFLAEPLCAALCQRMAEIQEESSLADFMPIHSYKTPCYRLYFEFADLLLPRLAAHLGADFAATPPLPPALQKIRSASPDSAEWRRYIYYFCEDRESGEAHNYFGNGGVF